MDKCKSKLCKRERQGRREILKSSLFRRDGRLLSAVLNSEHLYQLHVLTYRKPFRSKVHPRYSCATELCTLIRKTCKKALDRPDDNCISNSHIKGTSYTPARVFTAYVATFENSIGSYIKKIYHDDGTVEYKTMYQYSCKVVTSQEATL